LNLSNQNVSFQCSYTCEVPENFDGFQNPNVSQHKDNPAFERLQEASSESPSDEEEYDEKIYSDQTAPQPEALVQGQFELCHEVFH
jgi:hypothetical protein